MEEKKTLYKLDDYWIKELDKIDKIIGKSQRVLVGEEQYIEVEELLGIIEELDYELDHAKEELEDLQNDLESNYKPISAWEQSGMSYHDFI